MLMYVKGYILRTFKKMHAASPESKDETYFALHERQVYLSSFLLFLLAPWSQIPYIAFISGAYETQIT